jgi:peptidoglycan-N-acetylglucosamine deacetylase
MAGHPSSTGITVTDDGVKLDLKSRMRDSALTKGRHTYSETGTKPLSQKYGRRKLACLTFDFDVVSDWIFSGQASPATLSRGEFGLVGAARILALLEDAGIRSTWFIPGHTADSFPTECATVVDAGHELGHHGYLHEPPAALATRAEEEAALERGMAALRRLSGTNPVGYRSPSWDFGEHTLDLLLSHGFHYDSSLMAHDYRPYVLRSGDAIRDGGEYIRGTPSELVEMPVSWSLDDYPHFEYRRFPNVLQPGLAKGSHVLANFVDDFRYLVERVADPGMLVYTFHPEVIGRGHRMLMLESLIAELKVLGAAFVTLSEALTELRPLLQPGRES